ncbi:hypothetical protein BT63DRAFT_458687 [Microthyrium microscopicum]|uniref:SH3 domain-containing protein n=1 Tax=Microthyrium microscopicum TaxID=703497 RepID=A0A6A6U413_9PEZI|nr:hypothetical protein BT63DRAFT_458687 [Microthyrium microscopicum]
MALLEASQSPVPSSPRSILTPILTSPAQPSPRPSAMSAAMQKRFSTYSVHSNSSTTQAHNSRPQSMAFPHFHSSLSYALVRDFAYPPFHPLHYGPSPDESSGATTPSSDAHTRQSDPAPSWEEPKAKWPGNWISTSDQQLPGTKFGEKDGPPWSDDEDIQSPVVTSVRHRKSRRPDERRGSYTATNGDGSETYYVSERDETAGGPGGEFITYPASQQHPNIASLAGGEPTGRKRDSNFAVTLPSRTYDEHSPARSTSQEEHYPSSSPEDWDTDDSRYSRDYSFTIVSPDEEFHGKAVALFDFARESQNELPLAEGQIILVSYRTGKGWLVAQDPLTGESGLVPEDYVRLLRDIEGGWNGLMNGITDPDESRTPTQETAGGAHHGDSSNYTPVVSTFSTSRADFKEPWSRDKIASPSINTPTEYSKRIGEDLRAHKLDENELPKKPDRTSKGAA